jgi:hypothetical protein
MTEAATQTQAETQRSRAHDSDSNPHAEWHPTTEALAAYHTREVNLCVAAIKCGAATAQNFTLYSQRTWDAAVEHLGGMPVVSPADIERIDAIRAAAIAAANGRSFFGRYQPRDRRHP